MIYMVQAVYSYRYLEKTLKISVDRYVDIKRRTDD